MTIQFDFFSFSTVLKRFCPLDSKNIFVLVLAHLAPELELFEVKNQTVWSHKSLKKKHILTIFPALGKLTYMRVYK